MFKTTLHLMLFGVLFQTALNAQQVSYQWMKKLEVWKGEDYFTFFPDKKLIADDQGSVYRMGHFSEEANLGDTILYSEPFGNPYYLAKYKKDGSFDWARKISGFYEGIFSDLQEDEDWGTVESVLIEPNGNILIAGDCYADQLYLGGSDTLDFPDSFDDIYQIAFLARFSPSGELLWTQTCHLIGEDPVFGGMALGLNAQNQKALSFTVDGADSVKIGNQTFSLPGISLVTISFDAQDKVVSIDNVFIEGQGIPLPNEVTVQENGAKMIFCNVYGGFDAEQFTIFDGKGFSMDTRLGVDSENVYVLLNQDENGAIKWGLNLIGGNIVAHLYSDGVNHYLVGGFTDHLELSGELLWQGKTDTLSGFVLKLDQQGKLLWKIILDNAVFAYDHTSATSAIDQNGGILAPLIVQGLDVTQPRKIGQFSIKPQFEDLAALMAYIGPDGQMDTLLPFPTETGILFGNEFTFDKQGRIYGIFWAVEMDTLKTGPYTFPVDEEYTEFLACFTLGNLPPGLTSPRLGINISKNEDRLKIIRTFPNPTDGRVVVEWAPQEESSILVLRDASGHVLQKKTLAGMESYTTLDLSSAPAGIYLVEWHGKNSVKQSKLVKH